MNKIIFPKKRSHSVRSRVGSNQYHKRYSHFALLRASGFIVFWTIILLYLFRVGLQFVVVPTAKDYITATFKVTAYAPTMSTAYASESAKPIPTPYVPTKRDIIYSEPHGDIIYRIWGLESSFGEEPFLYCTRQGKVSDMGFNVLNHQCFDSFAQEVQAVNNWIEQHKNLPLGQLLCLYNKGTKGSCNYESNFLNL